jgi:hypothetical protein
MDWIRLRLYLIGLLVSILAGFPDLAEMYFFNSMTAVTSDYFKLGLESYSWKGLAEPFLLVPV